jgi:hypothetical protein
MGNSDCGNLCKKKSNLIIDLSKETNLLNKKISIKNNNNNNNENNSIMSINENSSEKNSEINNFTQINYKFLKLQQHNA